MKIAYLMQAGVPDVRKYPLSGPANHVKQTVTELQKLGHEVRLLAYLDRQIWKSDDLVNYEPVSVPSIHKSPLRLLERGIRRIQALLRLPYAAWFESVWFAQVCRQELQGYDLLYERMGWVGYGGALAARALKIPLILEVNGDHLTELASLGLAPKGMQRWLSMTLMERMIHSAAHIVATGDGWRTRFIQQWAVRPDLVTTIENGSEIVDLLTRQQLRSFQAENSTEKTTTLIFIGGFDPWQGIPVLLRAMARAVERGTQARLMLIGSGAGENEMRQLTVDLHLQDRIRFLGRLPASEIAFHLTQADIGLSPYCGRVEFSGLKLLDYKASGVAIIGSGQNGQPAILEHGRNAWIVPPCDVDALSEAIIRLSSDVELRKQLGRSARIDAEKCHSWAHTANQLDQLFSQVIDR